MLLKLENVELFHAESAIKYPAKDTTYLPPPDGAGEFIACTMSVVRASNRLVMNSTFFPSGHPGTNQRQKFTKITFHN